MREGHLPRAADGGLLRYRSQGAGLNTERISKALRDKGVRFRKGEENRALRELIDSGKVDMRLGSKGARLHYPAR